MPEKGGIVLNRRFLLIWILIAAMTVCAPAACAQAEVPFDEYVRFHVIAENDTAEAQKLKTDICAAIAGDVRALFSGCEDSGAAWETARENIGKIEKWARDAAYACGFAGEVTASAGICTFGERKYRGVTVPAGEYRTVRIDIGAGEGQNWWCVLYPSLCLPEDYEPGMKVEFYSSVIRWLKTLFGGVENG